MVQFAAINNANNIACIDDESERGDNGERPVAVGDVTIQVDCAMDKSIMPMGSPVISGKIL